jgi:hypothetical protein
MKPQKPIIITAEKRFELDKPRYNAHQTGTGAHKSAKAYTRKQKHKGEW